MRERLNAELRLKWYKSTIAETRGNEDVSHKGNVKIVGVFNAYDDVEIDITIKGDIGSIDNVIEKLNIPNVKDVIEIEFIPNPQVRIRDLDKKNEKEDTSQYE